MAGLPSGLSEKDLKVQVSSLLVKTWNVKVLENLESPGIFIVAFHSWKRLLVMENSYWNEFLMKGCGLT